MQPVDPSTEPLDVTIFSSDTLVPTDLHAELVGAGFAMSPARKVRRTVLETFDGRVSAAGLRLEVRDEGRSGPSEREARAGCELILSGKGTAPARVAANGVPRLAADIPAGPFRARLAKILDVRALVPALTMATWETTATKRDRAGKTRVSVTLHDQVTVEGFGPIPPGWGVEVGEVAGYAEDAERTRDLLREGGLQPSGDDLVEVAAAVAGVGLSGFHISPTVPLRGGEPALGAFRQLLANLAETVAATWQGAVDEVDPEFLHDLRVAVRRTRSVLAHGKGVLPAAVRRSHREGFGWLGTVTGRARDLDVYVIEWDDYVAPLGPDGATALAPVLDHLIRQRQAAHATMAEALRSDRYNQLMSDWQRWLRQPTSDLGGPEADSSIGDIATSRTAEAQRRLLERGRGIRPDSPAEDLHELRKDAKKLRYLVECFGSLYPSAPRKAFVQHLKVLQDNLGEHQDTEVHVSELRAIPSQLQDRGLVEPATLVAVGQLTEQLELRRRAAREDFANRFAAYDTKATRRSFQRLLRSAGDRR